MSQSDIILLFVGFTLLAILGVLILVAVLLRKHTQAIRRLYDDLVRVDTSAAEEDRFNPEKAEKWFEAGELDNLDDYCEHFFKSTPNSVHANWYYALSHYCQGDYDVAREHFEEVIRINPLWREGAVVYLQEIAKKTMLPNDLQVH